MSNENEPDEQNEDEVMSELGEDENANHTPAGSRAPSRAKSRGSIGDDRKVVSLLVVLLLVLVDIQLQMINVVWFAMFFSYICCLANLS